ncbi:MAG: tetratricopeptide repeat protein [Bifidobacteriaceae bacterium]|nr:tetratricopeptide repeat protein [Bifidobacteriaceae bacterium]
MEKITLRLGHTDELANDLASLEPFFDQLRKAYLDQDVELTITGQPGSEPPAADDEDGGTGTKEFWLFLFAKELTQQAKHEYDAARSASDASTDHDPMVSAWFKDLWPDEEATDGLTELRESIEADPHHRWSPWCTLGDLEFWLAHQLSAWASPLGLDIMDDHLVAGTVPLAELSEVRSYDSFQNLGSLGSQLDQLEGEIEALEELGGQEDDEELARANDEYEDLIGEIVHAEDDFADLAALISEAMAPDRQITARQLRACRRFQRGDMEGAVDELDPAELDAEVEQAEAELETAEQAPAEEVEPDQPGGDQPGLDRPEQARDRLQSAVRQWLTRADLLRALEPSARAAKGQEEALTRAAGIEKRNNLGAQAHMRLGRLLEGRQRRDEADAVYQAVCNFEPGVLAETTVVAAMMARVVVSVASRDIDQAEARLRGFRADAETGKLDAHGDVAGPTWLVAAASLWLAVGQPDEALADISAAIERLSPLAQDHPETYGPLKLHALETRRSLNEERGAWRELEVDWEESANTIRAMARIEPGVHELRLAETLAAIAAMRTRLERPEEALAPATEAVEEYRKLAAADAAEYGHDLAEALSQLGQLYLGFDGIENRTEDGIEKLKEAVGVLKARHPVNADTLCPSLAEALTILAVSYGGAGRLGETEEALEEAALLYRNLVAAGRSEHSGDLAVIAFALGHARARAGKPDQAESAYREAEDLYRAEADGAQDAAQAKANLGRLLDGLGAFFRDQDRDEEALEALDESVQMYAAAAKADPTFRPDWARGLAALGDAYHRQDQWREAEVAYSNAAAAFAKLAKNDPTEYRDDLISIHDDLAHLYGHLRRPEKEESALRAMVDLARQASKTDESYQESLAMSLIGLGSVLFDRNRIAKAEPHFAEAVRIYRRLHESEPGRHGEGLASALTALGSTYEELGRATAARAVFSERDLVRRPRRVSRSGAAGSPWMLP